MKISNMRNPKNPPTDPEEIVRIFQQRQKQIVVAFGVCFLLMVPLVIIAKKVNPFLSLAVLVCFSIPLLLFYMKSFRCPGLRRPRSSAKKDAANADPLRSVRSPPGSALTNRLTGASLSIRMALV